MSQCPFSGKNPQSVTLTSANGAPVANDNQSRTAGRRGPVTFDNHYLFEKLAHFNRERIPERVVHARGSAAYGTFTLTNSLSDYTIADFLQQEGQQTPVFLRFSTVGGGQDSSDYARDPRGFAVKFYTEQGNWDMVGNNTPVFFLRDGIKFPDFIHSQKKNPRTNLPDPQAVYEFWANNPQSLHQSTILMSDRGIPLSYRHVNGYSSHTLSLWNSKGERYWVKWHFKTNQGIKTLASEEAAQMPAFGAQQDLVASIDNGDYPSWTVKVQIMTEEEARSYHINPFDLTKVWPHKDFPLKEIGQLELNRNVDNYFAETEQAAFAPNNLVPGIGVSPDRMLQARLLAYQDAHRYRVGANVNQIPVNAPKCPVHNYQRDGAFAGINPALASSDANFYPNNRAMAGEPAEAVEYAEPPMPLEQDAWLDIYDTQDDDNFSQAGELYRIMNESQKQQLVRNIADGLSQATADVQEAMFAQYDAADEDYSRRVKEAVMARLTGG
ncbi:catalase [Alteromonas sp. 1_MG-2023]|uniref:catalase n=1 Tax=Alteromonas sp. 1_MG-2023 TaxID=3062669 RepID=UPI0026E44A5C|nr:catalase [Alteromonas sp. 1_MG-2023]MDO6477280.1 catalase [Alteromonas sp. 1_MG-2023]